MYLAPNRRYAKGTGSAVAGIGPPLSTSHTLVVDEERDKQHQKERAFVIIIKTIETVVVVGISSDGCHIPLSSFPWVKTQRKANFVLNNAIMIIKIIRSIYLCISIYNIIRQ